MNEEKETAERTKLCEACEREIPMDAAKCPHCGAKQPPISPDILKTAHD